MRKVVNCSVNNTEHVQPLTDLAFLVMFSRLTTDLLVLTAYLSLAATCNLPQMKRKQVQDQTGALEPGTQEHPLEGSNRPLKELVFYQQIKFAHTIYTFPELSRIIFAR